MAKLTWHTGSVLPFASLWHTLRRLAALNALQWSELPFTTPPSGGAPRCTRLDLLFNVACRDGYYSTTPGLSIDRLAPALAEPVDAFAWSHFHRLNGSWRGLLHPFMRICPACMAMGYHSALLCLKPLRRCPIHHLELVSRCGCGRGFDSTVDRTVLLAPGHCSCGRTGYFTRETCRRPIMTLQDTLPMLPVVAWLESLSGVVLSGSLDAEWGDTSDRMPLASLATWCEALGIGYPACFDPSERVSGLRCTDTPTREPSRPHARQCVMAGQQDTLLQRIDAETTRVYRALNRHLRRHHARGSESIGIDFLLHPDPLQMASALRENRTALMAFADLLFCRSIEPAVMRRRWPSRRPDDGVRGIGVRLDVPKTYAMFGLSPETQSQLARQVAAAVIVHAWRRAQHLAIAAVRTGVADWRGVGEPLSTATGSHMPQVQRLTWAASIVGSKLRFVSSAAPAAVDWSLPRPDKRERTLAWRRDVAERRAARTAACRGPCLTWSFDQGWTVVDSTSPGAGPAKRHRLLDGREVIGYFWLFAAESGFVARACGARIQTSAHTPLEAVNLLRLALRQFRSRFVLPTRPSVLADTHHPGRTDLQIELDARVSACLVEFGFWSGASRLHDIAYDHLDKVRRQGQWQQADAQT
jgi:hypothetical protein